MTLESITNDYLKYIYECNSVCIIFCVAYVCARADQLLLPAEDAVALAVLRGGGHDGVPRGQPVRQRALDVLLGGVQDRVGHDRAHPHRLHRRPRRTRSPTIPQPHC